MKNMIMNINKNRIKSQTEKSGANLNLRQTIRSGDALEGLNSSYQASDLD